MRQLFVQVPEVEGSRALDLVRRHDAVNVARTAAHDATGAPVALVVAHVSNDRVGPLVDALGDIAELRLSMHPGAALALHPPADEAAGQMTDVAARSPLEIFVAGMQSIGSWRGFVGYATTGGAVAWLGLTTNTTYLLVGAMLIAPFAGPAMNAAIATARGDLRLFGRALLRYGVALVVTACVAALLTLVTRLESPTELMASVSTISAAAVLLPLAAGAAGALHLAQGGQSSLVSGAATGMLVAASLAPPAAILGIATVTGDHAMLPPVLFLLALQFAGINLASALVLRLFGLAPEGARYARGSEGASALATLATVLALGALLAWQFGSAAPSLQRSSIARHARDTVIAAVRADGRAHVVEAQLRFTRASTTGQQTLLVVLHVRRAEGVTLPERALADSIGALARRAVRARAPHVTPATAVTVVSTAGP